MIESQSKRVISMWLSLCAALALFCTQPIFALEGELGKAGALSTYTLEEVVLAGLKENPTLRLANLEVSQAHAWLEAERGATELQGFIGPVVGGGSLNRLEWAEKAIKPIDGDLWEEAAHEIAWEGGMRLGFSKPIATGGEFVLGLRWGAAGGVGDGLLGEEVYTFDLSSEMTWTQPLLRQPDLSDPWWSIQRANDAHDKSKLARESETQHTIVMVTELFFDVVRAEEQLDIALQSLEAIGEQARAVEGRVSRGMGGSLDLKAMDIEVALARHAVSQSRRSLDLARRQLSQATGLNIGVMSRLLPPPPVVFDTPLDATVVKALTDSVQLRALTIDMDAARQAWRKAQQDSKPRVNTSLSINETGAWCVGVDVTWSFWDGHQARKRGEAAAMELQKSMTQLERLTEDTKLAIRREYYDYLDSDEQVELADLRLARVEDLLETTRRRYGLRMATELEMMDALNQLREAKAERATAVYRRTVAAIRLLARTDQLIRVFPNMVWGQTD